MIFNLIGRIAAWHAKRHESRVLDLKAQFKHMTDDIAALTADLDCWFNTVVPGDGDLQASRHRVIRAGREAILLERNALAAERKRVAAKLRNYGINMEATDGY